MQRTLQRFLLECSPAELRPRVRTAVFTSKPFSRRGSARENGFAVQHARDHLSRRDLIHAAEAEKFRLGHLKSF